MDKFNDTLYVTDYDAGYQDGWDEGLNSLTLEDLKVLEKEIKERE